MTPEDKKRSRRWMLIVTAALVAIPAIAVVSTRNYTPPVMTAKCPLETDHFARERMFRTCVASAPAKARYDWVGECGDQASKLARYPVCMRLIENAEPAPVPTVPKLRGPIGGKLYPDTGASDE